MGFLDLGLSWLIAELWMQCTFKMRFCSVYKPLATVFQNLQDVVFVISQVRTSSIMWLTRQWEVFCFMSLYLHFALMVIAKSLRWFHGSSQCRTIAQFISLSSMCCREFASIQTPFPISFLFLKYNREVLLNVSIGLSAMSRVCLNSCYCSWLV